MKMPKMTLDNLKNAFFSTACAVGLHKMGKTQERSMETGPKGESRFLVAQEFRSCARCGFCRGYEETFSVSAENKPSLVMRDKFSGYHCEVS